MGINVNIYYCNLFLLSLLLDVICSNQGGFRCCDLCTSSPCNMSFTTGVTYIGISSIVFRKPV